MEDKTKEQDDSCMEVERDVALSDRWYREFLLEAEGTEQLITLGTEVKDPLLQRDKFIRKWVKRIGQDQISVNAVARFLQMVGGWGPFAPHEDGAQKSPDAPLPSSGASPPATGTLNPSEDPPLPPTGTPPPGKTDSLMDSLLEALSHKIRIHKEWKLNDQVTQDFTDQKVTAQRVRSKLNTWELAPGNENLINFFKKEFKSFRARHHHRYGKEGNPKTDAILDKLDKKDKIQPDPALRLDTSQKTRTLVRAVLHIREYPHNKIMFLTCNLDYQKEEVVAQRQILHPYLDWNNYKKEKFPESLFKLFAGVCFPAIGSYGQDCLWFKDKFLDPPFLEVYPANKFRAICPALAMNRTDPAGRVLLSAFFLRFYSRYPDEFNDDPLMKRNLEQTLSRLNKTVRQKSHTLMSKKYWMQSKLDG